VDGTGGSLATNAGWIGQRYFKGEVTNCASSGNIGGFGSGIIGADSNGAYVVDCSSDGTINSQGGGIVGARSFNCIAITSISRGHILEKAGGIYGAYANRNATDHLDCVAISCGSYGNIGKSDNYNAGGIFGAFSNDGAEIDTSSCVAVFCFALGEIYGDESGGNGGIFGVSSSGLLGICCFTIGNIGYGCGGIVGPFADSSVIVFCYSLGAIDTQAGGILGMSCSNCNVQISYNTSTTTIGDYGGGICATGAYNCNVENSYSLGEPGENAGSIFGSASEETVCSHCYTLYGPIYGDEAVSGVVESCLSEEITNTWDDTNAAAILGFEENWISVIPDTPYLISSYYYNAFENVFQMPVSTGFESIYVLDPHEVYHQNGTQTQIIVRGNYRQMPPYPYSLDYYDSTLFFGYEIKPHDIHIQIQRPNPPPKPKQNQTNTLFMTTDTNKIIPELDKNIRKRWYDPRSWNWLFKMFK
jgi:hypothetical protein